MQKLYAALVLTVALSFMVDADAGGTPREDRNLNTPIPAGSVVVMQNQLGSGKPGLIGLEPATHMGEGIYHAPQYMAAFPTAATLFPRVVEVQCDKVDQRFVCGGYDWMPAYGRGEYLFIRPVEKIAATPQVVEKVIERVITVPGSERVIIKEVPVKPKKQ